MVLGNRSDIKLMMIMMFWTFLDLLEHALYSVDLIEYVSFLPRGRHEEKKPCVIAAVYIFFCVLRKEIETIKEKNNGKEI